MTSRLYFDGPRQRLGRPSNLKIYLQWKGGPCVDGVCRCGYNWHRCDTGFMYNLRCPKCDRVYHVGEHVEIVEMTSAEKASLDSLRENTYKPHSQTYVPWAWMTNLGGQSEYYSFDGEPGCAICFSSYEDCQCPCLAEQVKALKKEAGRLLVENRKIKEENRKLKDF